MDFALSADSRATDEVVRATGMAGASPLVRAENRSTATPRALGPVWGESTSRRLGVDDPKGDHVEGRRQTPRFSDMAKTMVTDVRSNVFVRCLNLSGSKVPPDVFWRRQLARGGWNDQIQNHTQEIVRRTAS